MGITVCANPRWQDKPAQVMVLTPGKAIEFVEKTRTGFSAKCFIVDEVDHLFK